MKSFVDIISDGSINISEFENFRKEQLAELKKRGYKGLAFGTAILVFSILISVLMFNGWLIIGGFVIGLIVFFIIRGNLLVKLQKAFKEQIIKTLIEKINPSFKYLPHEYISRDVFKDSQFIKTYSYYRGEDLFRGTYNGIEVEFSELHIQQKSDKSTVTVFKGPFFKIRSENNFLGRTTVLPDFSEKLLGKFGRTLQKLNFARDKLIQIQNDIFEKQFAVFSDNEDEAKAVINDEMVDFLLRLKETAKKVFFGFSNNFIYLGIYNSRDLYKVNIRSEISDQMLSEIYNELILNLNLTEEVYNLVNKARTNVPDPENRFKNINY